MYVLIAKGKFPRRVQKTDATVGWVEAESRAGYRSVRLAAWPIGRKRRRSRAEATGQTDHSLGRCSAWPEGSGRRQLADPEWGASCPNARARFPATEGLLIPNTFTIPRPERCGSVS